MDLFNRLPRAGNRILEHIEHDDPIPITLRESDRLVHKLDHLLTRLSLSILVGSLIIGLAFLVQSSSPTGWLQWIIVAGLVVMMGLGMWLFFSLVRSRWS